MIFIALFLSNTIIKGINELVRGAKLATVGDFKQAKVTVTSKDELGYLGDNFNKMLDSVTTNISQREQAQEGVRKYAEQLEQANIRLQEADRLKSVFLASMSHELRTPLNSIIGFTGIILQGMTGEITEEQSKQLSMVKNSANHLLSLINDLLDISKIEAEKVELSLEEFRLDDVVTEVVETFSPAVSEKGLKLSTEVPEGITLFSDKRRIKQVLMNLMSNAVKFTDQGSVKIAARVLRDDNLEIRVIDTGIGKKKKTCISCSSPSSR